MLFVTFLNPEIQVGVLFADLGVSINEFIHQNRIGFFLVS